ncbi:hypothetical protein ACQP1G_10625 [Nocardia sp. CA-107356]|uniref:hypothetical protein n=1 Tax=Nocardia sp. CA-107356 TaxID=3239972 RepID=UPI003D94CF77
MGFGSKGLVDHLDLSRAMGSADGVFLAQRVAGRIDFLIVDAEFEFRVSALLGKLMQPENGGLDGAIDMAFEEDGLRGRRILNHNRLEPTTWSASGRGWTTTSVRPVVAVAFAEIGSSTAGLTESGVGR